jgi:hypothetical protein
MMATSQQQTNLTKQRYNVAKNLTGLQYFWDLLPPNAQFILVNQSQILALPFNISQQLNQNGSSSLNWTSLPANVQAILLQQQGSLLFLSFAQWGWVDGNSSFANSTLFSLFPLKVQTLMPNITNLLAPLKYNLQIDLTVLNQTLYANFVGKRPKAYLLNSFFSSFFNYFSKLFQTIQNQKSDNWFFRYQLTPARLFSNAVSRACTFLKPRKFPTRY